MMGILYLFLCFTSGYAICTYAFPNLCNLTKTTYEKKEISLSPYLLLLPAWFITGTLALTWATYLVATLCSNTQIPLVIANAVVMPIAFLASALVYYNKFLKKQSNKISLFCEDKKVRRFELLFILCVILLANILMWTTFFVKDNILNVGVSVFSDFSPHMGMIRSFSYGNNFPTVYSHFAGEDIKYHFMFQFLVGNLEFLKLRIDYAFNIPSILSFLSAFMMLYVLAVKITGKKLAGILSCLFFAFRSSKTLFTYLSELPKGTDIIQHLSENTNFISSTPNEDWGLWNLNVYCNQRHLAFGLTVMLFMILLLLPRLYEMFDALKIFAPNLVNTMENYKKPNMRQRIILYIKTLFFTKDGWIVKDLRLSIASGILLGSIAFFHGAALIGCLLVLFIIAILSKNRLEFLIIAVITIGLSLLQSNYFMESSVISPKLLFGFIAENKTLFGTASYLERLLGVLPFLLLAAFCYQKGASRYLIISFTTPLIFALTVSLTTDVTVNHKYIMMSCILLGIFAASLLIKMLEQKEVIIRIVGIGLIITMTGTGIYDFTTVLRKNTSKSAVQLDLDASITNWIKENSDAKDIFLTSNYSLNQVVLGGAMLYQGWQYYAWSAGYDTEYRDLMVKRMYEADTPEQLDILIKRNQIRYIIVEYDNRMSEEYSINEENIKATYQCVYAEGEEEWEISIYDTKLPLFATRN